ncbi:MAG: CHAT domain-containing protein [Gammaproteobacteria bacterium]|nr:CHAT domain-containing protein [Gammaproteobacteria bacterium]
MSLRLQVHVKPLAAVGVVAALALLCVQFASAADNLHQDIGWNEPVSATLLPGESRRYRVSLRSGRNHVELLEIGIDLALAVQVDGREYSADSPTARFALEQVWFDLARDSEATIIVSALRSTGVPAGEYSLEIQSGYEASSEQIEAETLTAEAVNLFNASYAAGLEPAARTQRRRKSLDTYANAAMAWEGLNRPRNAAYCWHAAGFISSLQLSEHAKAQMFLERASRNYGLAELPEHKQVARKDVGQAIYREERYSTAAAYLSETATLTDDPSERSAFVGAVASNELCLLYKELGRFELAVSYCQRAMAAFQRIGDVIEYNNVLHNLAIAKRLSGDQGGAIELLYDLLERHEAVDEPVRHAKTLSVLAGSLIDSGNIDAALEAYDDSIEVFEREGLVTWQTDLLITYARIEQMLGRDNQARANLDKALQLVKSKNTPRMEGVITAALANIDLRAGRPHAAIPALQRAVGIFRQIGSVDLLVSASVSLAKAQLEVGWHEQANATISALGDESELHADARPKVKLTRARVLAQQGNVDEAIAVARGAIEGFKQIGSLTGQLQATSFEAQMLSRQERWDESLARLESLRVLVRRVGGTLILPQLKARFYSQQQVFYEALIRAYNNTSVTTDDAILKSLNVIEEARATALRAYLEAPGSWLENAPPEMRAQYDEARRIVADLVQDSYFSGESESPELIQALHHLERIQNSIWREHERFADISDETPITWTHVDGVLDERTAILYVYIGIREQFAVLLERDRRTRYEIDTSEPFDDLTTAFQEELRTPNSAFGVRAPSARSLSAALLEPIAARLETIDRLIIVPDAGLHNVPVAALPHPGTSRPMLETHEISNVASLRAALRYGARDSTQPPDFHVAAVGDPVTSERDPRLRDRPESAVVGLDRLWGARNEIVRLQRIFSPGDVTVYTGFDAQKSLFLGADFAETDILHISAHGVSNETLSARSGIFLTTMEPNGQPIDGHLGIEDLFGLELDTPLVVLSGCETSLGENTWSEGPVGIARAFQYSGVPSVVATLWRIDDKSSAILIETFYELLVSGETVPSALRAAQLSLMRSTDYRHPYYWAAFQSLGDWALRWENSGEQNAGIVKLD